MPATSDLQRRLGSIDELLRKVQSTADPSLRTTVQELVELIMNLHGAALERVLELVRAGGNSGELINQLGSDELVGSVLVLYGLHPESLETRAAQALDKVCSRLHLHDGEVELVSVEDGTIRLRVHAKGHGCGSTSLRDAVEEAMHQAVPDLTAVMVDGADDKQGFVPLEMLRDGALSAAGKSGL